MLYGDFNNWFAAFAFWVFKHYGYKDLRIIDGGRKKWLIEDRPISKDIPEYSKGNFIAIADTDNNIRAFFGHVRATLENEDEGKALVDVRSPKEFTGEVLVHTHVFTHHTRHLEGRGCK